MKKLILLFVLLIFHCSSEIPLSGAEVTAPGILLLEGFNANGVLKYKVVYFIRITNPIAGIVANDSVNVAVSVVGQAAIDSLKAGKWLAVEESFTKNKNESNASAVARAKQRHNTLKTKTNEIYQERFRFYGNFIAN